MADIHADDDIYPRSGETFESTAYYPKPDEEQATEDEQKAGVIAASLPIMDDVADWFREQIAASSDVHNIQTTAMTINGVQYSRTVSIEAQVLAYQLLKELLAGKLQEFETFGKAGDEA